MRVRHLSPAQISRLATAGVPPVEAVRLHVDMAPCASRHAPTVRARAYDHLRRYAGGLAATAVHLADAIGIAPPRTHAVLTPLSTFAASLSDEDRTSVLQVLDRAATDAAIDRVDVPGRWEPDLRVWTAALARAQRLYARLDASGLFDTPAHAAPLAALLRDSAGAHVCLAFGEPADLTDTPARLDVHMTWKPSSKAEMDGIGGLARVGHQVAAAGATALSRLTGLSVSAGRVEIAVDAAAWLAGKEGPLASLFQLDTHLTRRTLQEDARVRLVVPPHVRPSEALAVVAAGIYPLPAAPTAGELSDLAAACAATGHAALLSRPETSR